jgi:hypothetical protein
MLRAICALVALLCWAVAAQAFPELTKIYRFTGIMNTQSDYTIIRCANWSAVSAQVHIIIRSKDGETLAGPVYTIDSWRTLTAATRRVVFPNYGDFGIDQNMALGVFFPNGSMEIRATKPQVHCSVRHVIFFSTISGDSFFFLVNTLNGVRYAQEGGPGVQE